MTLPDSAHGISQLGYREPLESGMRVGARVWPHLKARLTEPQHWPPGHARAGISSEACMARDFLVRSRDRRPHISTPNEEGKWPVFGRRICIYGAVK